ncbi:hypothetical protein TWF679_003696 [Orbilia oligospora]|uniref:Uncharacterized protein n=1 Tax=Orbilia oligospora TaxID=2813651 RepID=A0A8H8VEZ9_ORBOL|nr:hypothetical protein TWF679_003696 [Orbilia oligospora]
MADFNSRVINLTAEKEEIEAALIASRLQIDAIVSRCTIKTFLALKSAMMHVYKLAVFTGGDFDKRSLDEEQQSKLSDQVVESFTNARNLAEVGTERLSAHHSALSNKIGSLTDLDKEISRLSQETKARLTSISAEMSSLRKEEATLNTNIQNQQLSLIELESKKHNQESIVEILNATVDIFTMGPIGFFISRMADLPRPSQSWNFSSVVDDTQNSINKIRETLTKTRSHMNKCRNNIHCYESQCSQLHDIQKMIPGLQLALQGSTSYCTTMIRQLLPLKKACIEFERKVGVVKQTSTVVTGQAIGRMEWAEGILAICSAVVSFPDVTKNNTLFGSSSAAIFNYHLAGDIGLITHELEEGWGETEPLPLELSKTINTLKSQASALLRK